MNEETNKADKKNNVDVPKHIAVILDGNRRYAKRLMLQPWKGHEVGTKNLERLLGWCKELGVKELTLYAFSMQNFNRPKEEFDFLMKIFNDEFDRLLNEESLHKDKVKVRVIGRIEHFPAELYEKMKKVMEMTKDYDNYIVNFAMAYGGREEIVDAVKVIAKKVVSGEIDVEDINQESFGDALYMNDAPELIIRTGGEMRTSNFLPWQSTYSEWFFVKEMWPEFTKDNLIAVFEKFNKRHRRFGK